MWQGHTAALRLQLRRLALRQRRLGAHHGAAGFHPLALPHGTPHHAHIRPRGRLHARITGVPGAGIERAAPVAAPELILTADEKILALERYALPPGQNMLNAFQNTPQMMGFILH